MPNIRQAIALLVAATGCIVFNTWRYPVVWNMVASVSQPAGAASGQTNSGSSSRSAVADRKGLENSVACTAGVPEACRDGVCTLVSTERPDAAPAGPAVHEPSNPTDSHATSTPAQPKPKSGKRPGSGKKSEALHRRVEPAEVSRTAGPAAASGAPAVALASQVPTEGSKVASDGSARPGNPAGDSSPRSTSTGRSLAEQGKTESALATSQASNDSASGSSTDRKQTAASSPAGDSSRPTTPQAQQAKPYPAESKLVPIQRPRSGVAEHGRGPQSQVPPGSAHPQAPPHSAQVRPLPPVDLAAVAQEAANPPVLTPEQIRAYPVTRPR